MTDEERMAKLGHWCAVAVLLGITVLSLTMIAGATYQTVRWLF